jgi:hypothetical protein
MSWAGNVAREEDEKIMRKFGQEVLSELISWLDKRVILKWILRN